MPLAVSAQPGSSLQIKATLALTGRLGGTRRQRRVQIVKTHQLVGLNCFDMRPGTFTNGQVSSKIDYVFTRGICVDKQSKEFRPHQDFPLIADQTIFHVPLVSSLSLHWFRKYTTKRTRTATLHKREQCHYARARTTAAWQAYSTQIQHLLQWDWGTSARQLEEMHSAIREEFDEHFPPPGRRPST